MFSGVVLGGAVRGGTKALQRLTAQEQLQDLHAASQHLEATAAGVVQALIRVYIICLALPDFHEQAIFAICQHRQHVPCLSSTVLKQQLVLLQVCKARLACKHCRNGVLSSGSYTQVTCHCCSLIPSMLCIPTAPIGPAVTTTGNSYSLPQSRLTLMQVTAQPACIMALIRKQEQAHPPALGLVNKAIWQRAQSWNSGQTRCYTWTRSPLTPRRSC